MIEVVEECIEKLHEVFERTDIEIELKKIEQKMEEARCNPGDVRPLADCIISILLAARSRGYRSGAVFEELERVARITKDKEWKKMPDGTYQAM